MTGRRLFAVLLATSAAMGLGLPGVDTAGAHTLITYDLVAAHSAKCMDVPWGSLDDWAGIIQFSCHEGTNQEVDIIDTGGGWHEIRFRHSNKCLDVPWGWPDDMLQLIQFQCNGQDNQRFQVPSCSGCIGPIKPKSNYPNKCLDVEWASQADFARIVQFQCNGQANQLWQLRAPRYRVWINPPGEGALSDYSHLHCKFHGQCGAAAGLGLDWDSWTYTGDRDGYLRTYTVNLGSSTAPLTGRRSGNLIDQAGCHYMNVDIFDQAVDPGLFFSKGTIKHVHTSTSLPGITFSIPLGWSQNYATTMVSEGSCPWTGYHIHEEPADPHLLANLNGDVKFNGGTYGDYCIPYANHDPVNDTCLRLKNNDFGNWSKYYDW